MKEKPTLGIIATAKYNHQKEEIGEMLSFYKERFGENERLDAIICDDVLFEENRIVETAKEMEKNGADAVVFIVGTWIFSSHIISAANDLHIPFILYGLSDQIANGNFGASLQIRYVLQEMGKKFLYLYGPMHDEENLRRIVEYTQAAYTKNAVRNAKIATIGGKCMMMYQTQVNEFSWKATFGVDFPQYDSVQVFTEMENVPEEEAAKVAADFAGQFDTIVRTIPETGEHIADDALLSQARMYLAFRRLRDMYGITVFANKCMPEMASAVYGYKYAACVATSLLNDNGIPTACEADLPAAVTMLILRTLTGQGVFFADIGRISADKQRITFFNCGSGPVSMADRSQPVELWPVPAATADEGVPNEYMTDGKDKQRGANTRFDLPNDEVVTIMRIGGNDDTLRFSTAVATTCPREIGPGEVFGQRWPGFGLKFKGNLDEFLQHTVGHHYVLVHGDWRRELRCLADMYGIGFSCFDGLIGRMEIKAG